MKQVVSRAYRGQNLPAIAADYQGFKEFIIEERARELCFEGLRKSDLARWGILVDYLTQEKADLVSLCNREGKYADVAPYRAYKLTSVPTLNDPTIALPYITLTEADLVAMGLSDSELNTMHILNSNAKGFLEKTLYEADGQVYLTRESVPAGAAKVEEVKYTLLNMFSIHSIKQKGNLSVKNVDGISSNNPWITGATGIFYGLEKNKVEILPFNTTSIIDVNPGLAGQQHPCY